MSRRVEWAKRALKRISRLDRPTQKRILGAVDLLAEEGRGNIRKLEEDREGEYRLRVGGWRVLFSYQEDGTVLIHRIGPRGDVYKG